MTYTEPRGGGRIIISLIKRYRLTTLGSLECLWCVKTMGQCQLEARFNISRDVSAKRSERSRPPRRARSRPPYGRRETSLVCRQTRSHCELQMFGSASGFGNEAPLLVRISLSRSLNFTEMRLVCFFFVEPFSPSRNVWLWSTAATLWWLDTNECMIRIWIHDSIDFNHQMEHFSNPLGLFLLPVW